MSQRRTILLTAALAVAGSALTGCPASSSTQCTNNDGGLGSVGGAVLGPADNHCFLDKNGVAPGGPLAAQVVNLGSCYTDAGFYPDAGPPAASLTCGYAADGGPGGCTPACDFLDGGPSGCAPDYGNTMFNSSGTDDDCKYQTGWTATPIVRNGSTTFFFSAVHTADGTPASGAAVAAEVYLPSANHPSPSREPVGTETPAGSGTYTIGPVVFDQPGQWVVRFHLHEECADQLPDSPHGHAAYYINVP